MNNEEKTIKKWSVWVSSIEVNDYYLTYNKARNLADEYMDNGYDDVILMSNDGGYDNV